MKTDKNIKYNVVYRCIAGDMKIKNYKKSFTFFDFNQYILYLKFQLANKSDDPSNIILSLLLKNI